MPGLAVFRRPIVLLTLLTAFGGCASGPESRIEGWRYAETAVSRDLDLVLMLSDRHPCVGDDDHCPVPAGSISTLQERFETCLRKGLARTAPKVRLVRREELDDPIWVPSVEVPATTDSDYGIPESRIRLAPDGVDYVIRMSVSGGRSTRKLLLEGHGDANGGVWALGQSWTKHARIETRIFDAGTAVLVGELHAELEKDAFWAVPVLLVMPLPPIGWSPDVKRTGCIDMGEALGWFFTRTGGEYLPLETAAD